MVMSHEDGKRRTLRSFRNQACRGHLRLTSFGRWRFPPLLLCIALLQIRDAHFLPVGLKIKNGMMATRKDGREEHIDRAEFTSLLVETLRENEALHAAPATRSDRCQAARDAFRALSFDFPLVETFHVQCLVEQASARSLNALPGWFWLSPKVREGIWFCVRRQSQPEELMRVLGELNILFMLQIPAKLLSQQEEEDGVSPERRRMLLLGDDKDENSVKAHARISEALNALLECLEYQKFATLTTEQWDMLRVVKLLLNFLKITLELEEGSSRLFDPQDRRNRLADWVMDLQASWPRFILVLRDRMTDHPESIKKLLPALLKMASMCHEHCQKFMEEDKGFGSNPVLIGVLRTLVVESAIDKANSLIQAEFWNVLDRNLVPRSAALLDVFRKEKEGTEQYEGMLDLLEYYGKGNPRQRHFSAKKAAETLLEQGAVRSVIGSWSISKKTPTPREIDFVLSLAVRSPRVMEYFLKTPGIAQGLLSSWELEPAREVALFLAIAASTSEISSHLEGSSRLAFDKLSAMPISTKRDELLKFRHISDTTKFLLDDAMINLLREWPECDKLVSVLNSVLQTLSMEHQRLQGTEKSPELQDLAIDDRFSRTRQLVKKAIVSLEGKGNKTD